MKTLKLIALAVMALMLSACANDQAKKVADKIAADQPLTQADYAVMIDYCGEYAQKAQPIQDAIDNLPDASDKAAADVSKLADLTDKYPYLDEFSRKISTCTQKEIGEDNVNKINSYASYTWFTVPEWAQINTDPNVEGFIEQMPDTDTSNVIATGEGEMVK